MAAEKKIRKSERDRHNLRDLVPLDTPFGINIEPTSVCNFKCRFCFHGDGNVKFEKGFMEFSLFQKIVDDLKEFPKKIKSVYLYHRGESLLHPQIAEMVKYVKQADVAQEVIIFTNASLLTPELSEKLIEAGLDTLNVSIEGISDEDYENVAGVKADFGQIVENVTYFYHHKKQCELYVKIPYMFYSPESLKKFESIFSEICDYFFEEHLDDAWQGLAKNNLTEEEYDVIEKRYKSLEKYRRQVCPCIFTRFNILYDGTVTCCLEDYKKDMPVGDVNNESVKEIWSGSKMNKIRYAHLTGNLQDYPMCQRNCTSYKDIHHPGNDMDNIDGLPQEIIDKFRP